MIDNDSPNTPYTKRLSQLYEIIALSGLDFIALNPGPSLSYLTGLDFHLMERPVVMIFPSQGPPLIVLPELEKLKLEKVPYPLQAFSYGEETSQWLGVFTQACQAAGLDSRTVGVEPTRLRYLELHYLEMASAQARFVPADESLSMLRIRKDSDEVSAMRSAVQIAQRALQATLPSIKVGATEREIASELVIQLYRLGSDTELPFSPIVSSGPNSANPHATPSDRPLEKGDLLVIDWGASYAGYISDLTRTFAVGYVEREFENIAQIVAQANLSARQAAGPEVTAETVDRAAREVIEAAGYGHYFIHRTGHGIGLEAHEPPYIRAGSSLALQPGMAFTVEPGIYLPGRGGVRIEDNVVITSQGAECLSDLPRQLLVLGQE
jgi:Xaa-Pro dipeptidase